jgi:hypothetical protein
VGKPRPWSRVVEPLGECEADLARLPMSGAILAAGPAAADVQDRQLERPSGGQVRPVALAESA